MRDTLAYISLEKIGSGESYSFLHCYMERCIASEHIPVQLYMTQCSWKIITVKKAFNSSHSLPNTKVRNN